MSVLTLYEEHLEQLIASLSRLKDALNEAGLRYRVVGGFAVYFHVKRADPLVARLTRDIDLGIDRQELQRLSSALAPLGFRHRHVAGVDMLIDAAQPKARNAVHLVFLNEKVRPEYVEAIPDSEPVVTEDGIRIASVADLVLMKLTSFRLKDKVHVQDMDGVGLITPEIEAGLPAILRERLAEVRATE